MLILLLRLLINPRLLPLLLLHSLRRGQLFLVPTILVGRKLKLLRERSRVSDVLSPPLNRSPLEEENYTSPLPHLPVGGRLSHFLDQWALITSDKWVLSILRRGLELQFLEQPPLSPVPINLSVTKDSQKNQLLQDEVNILIQKGVLEEVNPPFHLGFYSRLFLVPKKNGKMRPVLDLSVLNQYLVVPHFKMETNRSIRYTIHLGTWTTSLDLVDAYFHIPISHKFRHFLRLVWADKVYSFKAMPFGLAIAPLVFTRIFQTVVSYLHTQAVLIHSYLDDSLIKNHCRSLLEEHTNLSILLLLRLGFLISWEKSEIIPSQSFNFLGEHFRTDLGLVLPPEEKVVKVRQLVNALTQFSSVPARQLLQLVGFLISIMDVIPLGRLHIRPIQWYLSEFWHPISQLWEAPVPIPSSVVTSSSMVASGKTSSEGSFVGSSRPQPNFVHRCESDGLGSLSGGQDSIRPLVRCSVGGTHQSSRDESCVSFSPSVSGCDSGSVTTGCHGQLHSSGLSSESRRDPFLFSVSSEQGNSSSVSQSRYLILSVRHVPGSQNLLADALSRSRVPVNTEWEIHPSVFQEIILRWDRLENLHLHAWLLSGIPSEREAFLREQPSVSQDQSDNLQEQFMTPNGLFSVLGVCRSRLIHSLLLYNS
ncbi:Hypothetical predicted protein [Mytilus galloprovincialis]|uniref:Reverse transcriptase domain-containing protein n=1 Tax=Mytilus galloprovincialis TaxID=29158 RepID=A0A8B6FQH8_MYTGA|nr:Hypothetical predicted protein [Mytilus galloprovincialis]